MLLLLWFLLLFDVLRGVLDIIRRRHFGRSWKVFAVVVGGVRVLFEKVGGISVSTGESWGSTKLGSREIIRPSQVVSLTCCGVEEDRISPPSNKVATKGRESKVKTSCLLC